MSTLSPFSHIISHKQISNFIYADVYLHLLFHYYKFINLIQNTSQLIHCFQLNDILIMSVGYVKGTEDQSDSLILHPTSR